MFRFSKILLLALVALALGFSAWFYVRMRLSAGMGKPEISLSDLKKEQEAKPEPGEPAPIIFLEPNLSCAERQAFLTGDYKILRRVRDLPAGIQGRYALKGESRIAMADPGERFEATDVITDPTLPTRRLVFAGVAQDRAFLHYEQGGIGRYFVVEFFKLKSSQTAAGVWRGFTGPAKSLEDIRRFASGNDCK